ncbi:polysaccharide deacetylase family protein [Micromonospora sp. DT4]|uniref:polysaccharide deacetylase family protein n=1 Tax=Micromonospora sp. DT4 TaxID=3393438 RepID=UPI003CED0C6F
MLRLDGDEPVSRPVPDRTIALTFDDGPDPRWTPQVLDVLRRQVVLPLSAPAVDVFAVHGLLFLPWSTLALAWAGLLVLQAATAGYALRLDGERYGPLWALPFQQVVYRQVMYLVVVQSVVTALIGNRLRWQRMVRTGEVAALVGAERG